MKKLCFLFAVLFTALYSFSVFAGGDNFRNSASQTAVVHPTRIPHNAVDVAGPNTPVDSAHSLSGWAWILIVLGLGAGSIAFFYSYRATQPYLKDIFRSLFSFAPIKKKWQRIKYYPGTWVKKE